MSFVYTDEMLQWLRGNVPGSTWRGIVSGFNNRFGTDKSLSALQAKTQKMGIYPVGLLNGKTCWNQKPMGHTVVNNNGTILVKTERGYVTAGKLNAPPGSEGKIAFHVDGDPKSRNVRYITKKVLQRYMLNCRYNKGFKSDKHTAIQVCELEVAIKEVRQRGAPNSPVSAGRTE